MGMICFVFCFVNMHVVQGFIQDFSLGGNIACWCYDKTLLSLGGGDRRAPPNFFFNYFLRPLRLHFRIVDMEALYFVNSLQFALLLLFWLGRGDLVLGLEGHFRALLS